MPNPEEQRAATDANWTAVVAIANKGVIGRDESLPWRLSSDLQRVKRMTTGHSLVMGRKTFESIGRPLPGRQTIVLSRTGYSAAPQGITVVAAVEDVSRHVEPGRKVMIVGGAQIYAATLDHCSEIWLTRVLADVPGDTTFPAIDWNEWHEVSCEQIAAGPRDDYPTEFQIWRR